MATLIKLTKTDGTTQGGYHWDVGTTHRLPAVYDPKLCSKDVLHAYESAEVAAFMRHLHGYAGDVLAWTAEGDVVVKDAAKVGVFSLTITGAAELPQPTIKQTVLFACFCAQAVLPDGAMDAAIEAARRGDYEAAARAAADAADAAYAYAAGAADAAYAYAADAAAYARAAAAAAAYAYAADAAYAYAADAAYAYAADAAAYARAAADAANIDLHAIAVRALAE